MTREIDHDGFRLAGKVIIVTHGGATGEGIGNGGAAAIPLAWAGCDIGYAVGFLLSAEARYITGHPPVVDGGATLVGPARTHD